MRAKKRRLFGRVLVFVIAVVLLLGCAGGVLLWQYLQRYEHSQPDYYARLTVQAFRDKDTRLLSTYAVLPASLQAPEHLLAYLNESVDAATLHYARLSDVGEREQVYQIRTATAAVARLTVSPTGNRKLGLEYSIRSLELLPLHSYRFTVPSGVRLLVNGEPLPQRYLVSQQPVGHAFAELGSVYTVDTYCIDHPFYLNSVEATDALGNPAAVTVDRAAHTVTCAPAHDGKAVRDFAEAFIRPYLLYTTKKNAPLDPLLELLYPEGAFAAHLKQTPSGSYTYDTAECRDLIIDNVTALSETDWQCNVSLTYLLTRDGETVAFPFAKTLYITSRGGKLQLLNMSERTVI